jgi:hypothetical protein
MNRCIVTKYHGPTNTRGSRIIATAYGKRVTFPWDYAESVGDNHAMAAVYAARKLGWNDGMAWVYHTATAPDGCSRVHVLVPADPQT